MDSKPPKGVVWATPEHLDHVANRLRDEHVREIAATSSIMPADAFRTSFQSSVSRYAALRNGRPLFLMGVEPMGILTASAAVWMVGTDEIDRYPGFVLRAARWGVLEAYRSTGAMRLEQWIPAWYETGLRFVERLGFVRHPGGELVRVTHEKEMCTWD